MQEVSFSTWKLLFFKCAKKPCAKSKNLDSRSSILSESDIRVDSLWTELAHNVITIEIKLNSKKNNSKEREYAIYYNYHYCFHKTQPYVQWSLVRIYILICTTTNHPQTVGIWLKALQQAIKLARCIVCAHCLGTAIEIPRCFSRVTPFIFFL